MSGSLDAFRARTDPGTAHARPGWFIVLGILLVATGVIAWIDVVAATLASTILIGLMLAVAGVVQVVHALAHRTAGRRASPVLSALIGVLYVVGGIAIAAEPVRGSLLLTAFLAFCLIFAGIARLAWAAGHRHMRHWWGLLLSGLVALGVGVLVYASLPWSGLFLPGTLVAIELVVAGISTLAFGLTHRGGAELA